VFIHQAEFLESIYRTGVDFRQIGWQQLDPSEHGLFDLEHCHGVLHHEPNPIEVEELTLAEGPRGEFRTLNANFRARPGTVVPELRDY